MRRRHRIVAVALGATALAITASGCGIAPQSTAQPFNVPANQFTSPTTPPTTLHPGRAIDVFFLTDGYLVASVRHLPRRKLTLDLTSSSSRSTASTRVRRVPSSGSA